MSRAGNAAKQVGIVILIILVLLAIVYGMIAQTEYRNNHIKNWAGERNYRIVSIEQCIFNRGPYWHLDDEDWDVYQVELFDSYEHPKTVWFAFSAFYNYNTEDD